MRTIRRNTSVWSPDSTAIANRGRNGSIRCLGVCAVELICIYMLSACPFGVRLRPHTDIMMDTKILRMPEVREITGLSKSGIYKLLHADPPDTFPRPVKLGKRAVGWRVADVEAWLASRPDGGFEEGRQAAV